LSIINEEDVAVLYFASDKDRLQSALTGQLTTCAEISKKIQLLDGILFEAPECT
jgi:hypothetical protein